MPCSNNQGKIPVRIQRIYNGASLLTRGSFSSDQLCFCRTCYTEPLTYVSARGTGNAEITSVNITPSTDGGKSRVSITFEYNVIVTFKDAFGNTGYATVRMTDSADILITLPDGKYELSASVEFASVIGSITPTGVSVTACRRLKLIILVPCDVVICSSGDISLPDADETENAVCRELQ